MGTRADFYLGRGVNAEWLGSLATDAYPLNPALIWLFEAKNADEFKQSLRERMAGNESFTSPEQGWPWAWNTSHTTDYAYAFDEGQVWVSFFGTQWHSIDMHREPNRGDLGSAEDTPDMPSDAFPDMSERREMAFGTRSGFLLVAKRE